MKPKTITYRELLERIAQGRQPGSVYLEDDRYDWHDTAGCYVHFNNSMDTFPDRLRAMLPASEEALANDPILTTTPPILKARERIYLRRFLKPYKVDSLVKRKTGRCEYLEIFIEECPEYGEKDLGRVELPAFPAGRHYAGMEVDELYTPQELSL